MAFHFASSSPISLPNYNFPFKLESDNYVLWKSQILPAIIGSNMESFIIDPHSAPSQTITEVVNITASPGDSSSSTPSQNLVVPNPAYQEWRRNDQALVGWLLSSISKDIHMQVSKVSSTLTSFQLWNSLERLFGSRSRAKLMQLKLQFQSTKKDDLSVTNYFCKMKEISDGLVLAGDNHTIEDFIMQLLQGVPSEYDAVVANINSRQTDLTTEEVLSLLLSHEIRLQ